MKESVCGLYALTPAELFNRIPEHLRDQPHEGLMGQTPREALEHADMCRMCYGTLQDIVAANEVAE